MAPAPSVEVEAPLAHLNSREPLLVSVAMSLIFPRGARISQDKTLQEAPLLPYPTHLDQTRASCLVGAHRRRHSPEDPDPAMLLLDLHLLVFHQGGTGLSPHRQEALPLAHERASPGLLLHPQTAADLLYRQLLEGGPHFLTTGLHHHQLLWEVIGHLCPAMFPLLLPLSTPNRLPLSLPPLLVPPLVGVRRLSHRADRALLLSHPPQLEGMITTSLVFLKGTAHLTALQVHRMAGQDLSLPHRTRGRHLLEGTSLPHAQGPFLPLLPQVVAWVEEV